MRQYAGEWEGLFWDSLEFAATTSPLELEDSALILHPSAGARVRVEGRHFTSSYTAKSGSFDFLPAGRYLLNVTSGATNPPVMVRIPVAFEVSVRDEGRWQVPLLPRLQFSDRRLYKLLCSLFRSHEQTDWTLDAVLYSAAIVDRLFELSSPSEKKRNPPAFTIIVRRLLTEYIDSSLSSNLDGNHAASLTGFAIGQFSKRFRNSFGVPLHNYVIARKIEFATKRLLDDVLVTEISQELGFSSHAHFSTVFSRHVGRTPSQYRRDMRAASTEWSKEA